MFILFVPDRVLPVSVKNTSTGRDKRLYPTKTVYGSLLSSFGWKWISMEVETGNKKVMPNQILYEGKIVNSEYVH